MSYSKFEIILTFIFDTKKRTTNLRIGSTLQKFEKHQVENRKNNGEI